MEKVIALEGGLKAFRPALVKEGFRVVELNRDNLKEAHAVVLTGGDDDFMQMEDIKTTVPVINAEGKSAQEIISTIKKKLVH